MFTPLDNITLDETDIITRLFTTLPNVSIDREPHVHNDIQYWGYATVEDVTITGNLQRATLLFTLANPADVNTPAKAVRWWIKLTRNTNINVDALRTALTSRHQPHNIATVAQMSADGATMEHIQTVTGYGTEYIAVVKNYLGIKEYTREVTMDTMHAVLDDNPTATYANWVQLTPTIKHTNTTRNLWKDVVHCKKELAAIY